METEVIETGLKDEKVKEILTEANHYSKDVIQVISGIIELTPQERLVFAHAVSKMLDMSVASAFPTKDEFNQFKQKISFFFTE